jgi:hypothetical protein
VLQSEILQCVLEGILPYLSPNIVYVYIQEKCVNCTSCGVFIMTQYKNGWTWDNMLFLRNCIRAIKQCCDRPCCKTSKFQFNWIWNGSRENVFAVSRFSGWSSLLQISLSFQLFYLCKFLSQSRLQSFRTYCTTPVPPMTTLFVTCKY